jgi:hypothetical protein
MGPRAGLDDVKKRKFLNLPGLELGPLSRPSRNAVAIPAPKYVKYQPKLRPTQSPIHSATGALSPGVMLPERETNHSPLSSVDVKNGGTIPPLPYMSSWRGA